MNQVAPMRAFRPPRPTARPTLRTESLRSRSAPATRRSRGAIALWSVAALGILSLVSAGIGGQFGEATAAFQLVGAEAADSASLLVDQHLRTTSIAEDYRELQADHSRLQAELGRLRGVEAEHVRLMALLDLQRTTGIGGVVTRVIARSRTRRQTIRLDIGSARGVAVGDIAMGAGGVIGQLVDVGASWADVLAVTDRRHAVQGMLGRSGAVGTVRGDGVTLAMEHVLSRANVEVGEWVYTSGEDGIYPRGLPVGEVESVSMDSDSSFLAIVVRPFSHPALLSEVTVVRAGRTQLAVR